MNNTVIVYLSMIASALIIILWKGIGFLFQLWTVSKVIPKIERIKSDISKNIIIPNIIDCSSVEARKRIKITKRGLQIDGKLYNSKNSFFWKEDDTEAECFITSKKNNVVYRLINVKGAMF